MIREPRSTRRARPSITARLARRVRGWGRGVPLRVRLAVGLAVVGIAGCRDAPMDPLVSLVTPETAAAVDVPLALPDLAELAHRTGIEVPEGSWIERWQDSWTDPLGSGPRTDAPTSAAVGLPTAGPEQLREEAVRRLAPLLADSLGPGGTSSVLAPLLRVEQDLGSLSAVPGDLLPSVLAVRSRIEEARRALAEGRTALALEAGLIASDQLRSIGPTAIARTLIARADRALMATVGVSHIDELSVSRGERMLDGARRALDEADVEKAVQRAFYAVQLLEQARGEPRPLRVDTIG